MAVGVLALQGNFSTHAEVLERNGVTARELRKPGDLQSITGLVLPGGESSTILSLLSTGFREALVERIRSGLPTLATCAGLILLARRVKDPEQESFGLLNIDIQRNAYGRQLDSFVANLEWVDQTRSTEQQTDQSTVEGVFIRAPRITRIGDNVSAVLRYQDDVVLVRYRNIIGATFHPELSRRSDIVYDMFLSQL